MCIIDEIKILRHVLRVLRFRKEFFLLFFSHVHTYRHHTHTHTYPYTRLLPFSNSSHIGPSSLPHRNKEVPHANLATGDRTGGIRRGRIYATRKNILALRRRGKRCSHDEWVMRVQRGNRHGDSRWIHADHGTSAFARVRITVSLRYLDRPTH